MQKQPVTVIGLGLMGHAMASTFLHHGHEVTVWNRTGGKADDLVANGARLAPSPAAALAASELIVLSLTDCDAMYVILEDATEALRGRTLANLTSDTPDQARAAAAWAAEHGARYLTGGVQASPAGIGDPSTFTFYSGPESAFEAHKGALEVLNRADYLGADPGLAALFYQLRIGVFWTVALAWLQALAVARANGISARDMLPHVSDTVTGMPDFFRFYTERIDAGEYPGDVDRLAMGVASVDHARRTAEDAGADATLPAVVLEIFERGIDAGHADDSFTRLIETIGSTGP